MSGGTNEPRIILPEELFNSYMENEELIPSSLAGKTVAITGTTSGLGFAIARCAVLKHASLVLLLNRKSERSQKCEKELHQYLADDGSNTVIKTIDCDLMSFDSVKKAAEEINKEVKSYGGLDVLCLNAGIAAYDDDRTKDGFDVQMQTNMLSHFLLTQMTYDAIRAAADKNGEARIVSHSSSARDMTKHLQGKYFEKCEGGTLGGNDAGMLSQMVFGREGPWMRYIQSKLANSAFAMALHRKLLDSKSNIKSVAAEPGYSVTPIQSTKHFTGSLLSSLDSIMPKQSAADGSLNAIMACFSSQANSGDLYAPKSGFTGPPVKVVADGIRQKTGYFNSTDKGTCDLDNQKLVWEACEKALGIEFAV